VRAGVDVVEVYPYVPYIQYLLPGSITMSIFMMVMIGGGIIFIDDKAARPARGLSRHADHQARAGRRVQHLGHHQGRARRAAITIIGSIIAGVPSRSTRCAASDDAGHFDHGRSRSSA
jgi:ABC-2 type transport system permease protein